MARQIEDEIEHYYDSHSTEEDLMGETVFHFDLVQYLVAVLTWLFQDKPCALYGNLNIYQTTNDMEYPLAPDVAVFKGTVRRPIRSWTVGRSGPAPQVVFEIASGETWAKDLREKPARYARMGVQEYFAYDLNEPVLPQSGSRRLYGWRLDRRSGVMHPLMPGKRGELWSQDLESWLIPDGTMLRLYNRQAQLRLTGQEAEAQRADIEARRNKSLEEKLRSLGIDPDQIV